MDASRFDALTRALARVLSAATARRGVLAVLTGSLLAVPALPLTGEWDALARKKRRKKRRRKKRNNKKKAKGPCAAGKSKKNTCKKDRNCCTQFCKKGKCRCRNEGQSCSEDANCCPESTARHCSAGSCQPCDVCASGCQFSTVAQAIAGTASGGTIRICAGTFKENLNITKDLTLIGSGDGEDGTILDGQQQDNVIFVDTGKTVELQALRITQGNGILGGGIANGGTLTVRGCTVTNNVTPSAGGGIINGPNSATTIIDSTVTLNQADFGAGLANADTSTLTLTNTAVTNNEAANDGGGILNAGIATLNGSSVTNNTAGGDGGGIFNDTGGTVTLNDSTVADNTPDNCDGPGTINGDGCAA